MPQWRPIAVLLFLSGTLCSNVLAEQDDAATRSAGRKLAQDGVALLQQGKPDLASAKLEKAYELLQVPSVALWSGRALAARGRLVEASERFVEASRLRGFKGDQQVQQQAQQDAAHELETLTPRVPTLVILLALDATERPTVTLDGKTVPTALLGEEQPVNPGVHLVKIVLGSRQTTRSITLAEGEKKRESVSWEDVPVPSSVDAPPATTTVTKRDQDPTRGRRTLGYVALATGGVSLLVGGVTGGLALSKHHSLTDGGQCAGDRCLPGARSDVQSLDTLRTVSTVGFMAGGVLAAAGFVLVLTGKPHAEAQRTRPYVALQVAPSQVAFLGGF